MVFGVLDALRVGVDPESDSSSTSQTVKEMFASEDSAEAYCYYYLQVIFFQPS